MNFNFEPPQNAQNLLQLYNMDAIWNCSPGARGVWHISAHSRRHPRLFVSVLHTASIETWILAVKRLDALERTHGA
jgi:hypothetical protein